MIESRQLQSVLQQVLAYAERADFAGYSKFDALNSPWLDRLAFNTSLLRFVYTQSVMRAPWNLRPWLGVKPSINPKGMALFALAYLQPYRRTGPSIASIGWPATTPLPSTVPAGATISIGRARSFSLPKARPTRSSPRSAAKRS